MMQIGTSTNWLSVSMKEAWLPSNARVHSEDEARIALDNLSMEHLFKTCIHNHSFKFTVKILVGMPMAR